MTLYGLIGYPLAHSFSKKYFTEKFKNEKIDAQFINYEIQDIRKFIDIIKNNPNLKGLSVTIPHKEKILPLLDEIDDSALQVGAVNSIKIYTKNGKKQTKGFNTDVFGFKKSLFNFLGGTKPTKALILGTGGAAKAVAIALKRLSISYVFVSRTKKNEETILYSQLSKEILQSHLLIINTTPLGMYPQVDTFPSINYKQLSKRHYLYDLTYNPEETLFLKKGEKYGANTKNGLDMLHLQAEKSWQIWNDISV